MSVLPMNPTAARLLWASLLVANISGCGNPELSRDQAAEIIASSPEMKDYRSSAILHSNARQIGVDLDLWQLSHGRVENLSSAVREMASEFGTAVFGFGPGYLKLRSEVALEITVTGLTGGKDNQVRKAEFDWRYADLPLPLRYVSVAGGKGTAIFQLYDDGWRLLDVEKIDVDTDQPFPLSDSEKAQLRHELAAVHAQRTIEAEKQAAAQARQLKARQLGNQHAQYIAAISNAVTRNWLRPLTAQPGLKCTVRVVQIPGGEIISSEIIDCNGDDETRQSILSAVNRTAVLPYRGYENVFAREMEFNFVYAGD